MHNVTKWIFLGLNINSTFCLCADGFQGLSKAFHYTIQLLTFYLLKLLTKKCWKILTESILRITFSVISRMFSSADLSLAEGKCARIKLSQAASWVGNLSPPMGARNQVGIGLSYRPASLCSLATQFQTRFQKSIPRPIAGLKIPMPEIIDPVFAKTSQNARFLLSENERFGLVFMKTGSINSGTTLYDFTEFHRWLAVSKSPL